MKNFEKEAVTLLSTEISRNDPLRVCRSDELWFRNCCDERRAPEDSHQSNPDADSIRGNGNKRDRLARLSHGSADLLHPGIRRHSIGHTSESRSPVERALSQSSEARHNRPQHTIRPVKRADAHQSAQFASRRFPSIGRAIAIVFGSPDFRSPRRSSGTSGTAALGNPTLRSAQQFSTASHRPVRFRSTAPATAAYTSTTVGSTVPANGRLWRFPTAADALF